MARGHKGPRIENEDIDAAVQGKPKFTNLFATGRSSVANGAHFAVLVGLILLVECQCKCEKDSEIY